MIFRMFRRALMVFLIIVLLGYGALEVAAKTFAERRLEELAEERHRLALEAQASVSVPLLYGIVVNSRINRVEIATTQLNLGPFVADRAGAVIEGIHLDRLATLAEREPVIQSIDRLEMFVEFTSEEASRVLPEGFSFAFVADGSVQLQIPGGNSVRGRLVIIEGVLVRFDPEAGAALPPGLRQPLWSFVDIPFVTCLQSVEIRAGTARITCVEEDPPSRFPPGWVPG